MRKIYILNSPILTNFGKYNFYPITIDKAKEILSKNNFISAIGHETTAQFLSQLLECNISFNRIKIEMQKGDIAIVFQLKERLPEGKILTEKELQNIKYNIAILEKIE